MKTLELKLPTPVLLVWGLPEVPLLNCLPEFHRYKDFLMVFTDNDIVHFKHDADNTKIGTLPEGNWQLIGKLSELTDAECCKIVDVSIHSGLSAHYTKGVNPPNVYCYESPLDSLHSAIEAEGHLLVNPCKHPDEIYTNRDDDNFFQRISMKKWNKAQSKTLPANTLIFKRV